MMKVCNKCKKETEWPKNFKKGGKKKNGDYYIRSYCMECDRRIQTSNRRKNGVLAFDRIRKDLTNMKFGELTVIGEPKRLTISSYKKLTWKCKCSCGNICRIHDSNLKAGHSLTCGCARNRRGENNKCWKGYKGLSGRYFNMIKDRAERLGWDFNLNLEYLWGLFENQNGKCKLSGIIIIMDKSASVDRIDSNIGYIIGNVQWVHKDVNKMKMEFNQEYFIDFCTKIADYNKSR